VGVAEEAALPEAIRHHPRTPQKSKQPIVPQQLAIFSFQVPRIA
jgi:hypothetical protein